VQFGINSTREWLLIARGEAKRNPSAIMPITSVIHPKLYEKTC